MVDEVRIFCLCGRVPYAHIHKVDDGCPETRVRFSDLPTRNLTDENITYHIIEWRHKSLVPVSKGE